MPASRSAALKRYPADAMITAYEVRGHVFCGHRCWFATLPDSVPDPTDRHYGGLSLRESVMAEIGISVRKADEYRCAGCGETADKWLRAERIELPLGRPHLCAACGTKWSDVRTFSGAAV